ncbi:glycosyltransferase family 4 protein [Pedobacter polysacchareus]|uniref:glycosyltransferase family 4 protein n=1 Tax=Pedobacter polysacchareus TaxID=2861973 RepID=UPI001C994C24|nr:glycosyltransferase family 4 protein [Pedobacter polysacchareus]
MDKLKILVLLDYYLPGYKGGGPSRSIKNMVDQLGDEFEFMIITTDRDLGNDYPYPNIIIDKWTSIGDVRVYYVSPENLGMLKLARLLSVTEYDILYLNSFFQPRFAIGPLFARFLGKLPNRPIVIAPRGELLAGCLNIKPVKKKVYLFLAKMLGMYKGLTWQASSIFEVESFTTVMGKTIQNTFIAPNLPPRPELVEASHYQKARDLSQPFRICFISRLTQEKNLDYALNIIIQLNIPLVFDIYGPQEDEEYWRLCEGIIKRQKYPVTINYCGNLMHDQVNNTFRSYDLFFFPTHAENFGHVIIESMLVGTPVLISDNTPWKNLMEKGVGWDLSLGMPNGFINAIKQAAGKNAEEYYAFRENVRKYAVEVSLDAKVLEANRELFKSALQIS